ncbi:MAG: N-acetyltransferase [Acetobacteraceae bacterium]|nr:N-acetyltransferase [Acetobacteraceae bacterium]
MPDGTATLTLALHTRVAEIASAEWDACADRGNPFVSHAFLSAIEDSGSASARTGWLPQHAVLRAEDDRIVAVAPMYAKSHSYGEYVFDHGWAHALERAGGSYYPKLQVAVPFSPVPGPRLLRHPDAYAPVSALASAFQQACRSLNLSSVHVTFCTEEEWRGLGEAGWLRRLGMQFHWENEGYSSFDDFLSALSSRKRKVLRRERRDANAAGLTFRTLTGAEITEGHWDAFYRFYRSTVDRKWGSAYLTRPFFSMLGGRLGDRVVLMLAENAGKPVAGALNLAGDEALYGRNWGCRGDWPFLHFELCYYRAIDWAIEHGLKRVEAGAQGRHKIQRGYLPKPTFSAHWIAHAGLRRAVANFLDDERPGIVADMVALSEQSPFRRQGSVD